MRTIKAFETLLTGFKQQVERIVATTEADYKQQVEMAKEETMTKLKKLGILFPDMLSGYGSNMSTSETSTLIDNLKRRIEGKYMADLLPSGEMLSDTIYGVTFNTPAFIGWQGLTSREANFVISYNKLTAGKAIKTMNSLVSSMLLSLPVKGVHLNFVDLNFTGGAQLFTQNLDKSLFRDLIVDTQQLGDFCKEMQQRMVTVLQECGDLAKYNKEHQTFRYPYEVVVLLDYPNMYDYASQQLVPLFENGHKGGIYFVVMNNTDCTLQSSSGKSLIEMKDHYYEFDQKKAALNLDCLLENPATSKAVFSYINEEATRKPKARVVKAGYDEMYKQPYSSTDSIIEVPIGEEGTGKKINFMMNAVDHIHCFILGQSGSGKSVFLHNIIAGAMLKYRPEDLQFYLLDFKLGGVEFNRYKNSKHVKALLVDNSDVQITLEILRDLNEQMKERGKMLQKAGVSNITDYNRANPDSHMPQIMLVADECHAMFNASLSNNQKLFREMSEIIARIAKEGRSQGVHLILATQTLAQTDISSDILNNISDHYLLKCAAADAEKMIKDSSEKTANLATGQVYYRFKDQHEALFQAYFTENKEVPTVTDYISRKADKSQSNGQFYFNGSQLFCIDKQLIDGLPSKRSNVAALGCSVSLKRDPVNIALKDDDGENILFFGINDEEQVTRTVMNALTTLIYTAQNANRKLHVSVIDSLGLDDGDYLDQLDQLEGKGFVTMVKKSDIGRELLRLGTGIQEKNADPSLLVILGQERIRGLRLNDDIEVDDEPQEEEASPANIDLGSMMNFSFDGDSGSGGKKSADLSSYRKALSYILDNGPQAGVHTLLQIDAPSKLLYEDYVSAKTVFARFNHLVMLRSEQNAAASLSLSDDIHLEQLPSDPERLRAVYYASDRDSYQMFTPYMINQ